jgi:hypothetical protein
LADFTGAVRRLLGSGDSDCLLFEDLGVGSPLWQALGTAGRGREAATFYRGKPQRHWWIRFPENGEQYWGQFSRKTRYNLRRAAKKLDHTLAPVTEASQVVDFLAKVHQVEQKTWQARRLRVRFKNSPRERRFWEGIASLGALRSYLLEQKGQPLAFVLGIQWNGCFIYYDIGYDAAYAQYSPGTVLLFRLLEDLIARTPPRLFDFGFGDADYKQLFGNHQTLSGSVLLVRRAWRPLATASLDRLRYGISQGLRAGISRLGFQARLKGLYRG